MQVMGLTMNKKFLTVMQTKTLSSSTVNSQFNYCAIGWIFCSRKSKLRLANIHKRTLRVTNTRQTIRIYLQTTMKNYNKDLLADHHEISIQQKHLQFLANEVFKSANKLNAHFT